MNTIEYITKQQAIDALEKDKAETDHIIMGMSGAEKEFSYHLAQRNQLDCDIDTIKRLPSADLPKEYAKSVWLWMLNYQIKAAELQGRYTPYEVLSWVANDWRKENGLD